MPLVRAVVDCPVHDSFRVRQLAGMFDVPWAERASANFEVDVPELGDDWHVGLIVGPSGSGKTTIARELFGQDKGNDAPWGADQAVIDGFGELTTREIVGLLTAVGFSSPPAWLRPYAVLSGGERFRCDLARRLAQAMIAHRAALTANPENAPPAENKPSAENRTRPLVVFDEFTSVVDRRVAQLSSAVLAKSIRGGRIPCRFVAVTCHYDVAAWLEADWVIDMGAQQFQRRRLRRPTIELEVRRCRHRAWRMFARHHYLSGALNPAARCYLAAWHDLPVAFCATVPLRGHKQHRRITRLVTLPDFQGLGIGMHLAESVAWLHRQEGHRVNITASHPAIIAHCGRGHVDRKLWRLVRVMKSGHSQGWRDYRSSTGRAVVSFEYLGRDA